VDRDGVEPPVGLALGGLSLAQQHRALTGGEVDGLGVVAQVLGLPAPTAGAGKATGVGGALKVGVTLHGELLKRERPARRLPAGWVRGRSITPSPGAPGRRAGESSSGPAPPRRWRRDSAGTRETRRAEPPHVGQGRVEGGLLGQSKVVVEDQGADGDMPHDAAVA